MAKHVNEKAGTVSGYEFVIDKLAKFSLVSKTYKFIEGIANKTKVLNLYKQELFERSIDAATEAF